METVIDISAEHMSNVFGQFDSYMKKVERAFGVTVVIRESKMKLIGTDDGIKKASRAFAQLFELSGRGNRITEQNVDYAIALTLEEREDALVEIDKDLICHTIHGKPIKPKTLGHRPGRDREDVPGDGNGDHRIQKGRSQPDHPDAPGDRGGREAGVFARGPAKQDRPVPAPAL